MKNVQQIVNLSQSNIIDIRHNEMNNAEKTNLQVVEATVGWIQWEKAFQRDSKSLAVVGSVSYLRIRMNQDSIA